jgi:hypothetical protein
VRVEDINEGLSLFCAPATDLNTGVALLVLRKVERANPVSDIVSQRVSHVKFPPSGIFCAGFHFSFLSRIFPVDDGNSFRL